jgi:outer membrane protein insertion porin family
VIDHASIGVFRGGVVSSVAVKGVEPHLAQTLQSVVTIHPGDRIDHDQVAENVRKLWALGMFSDLEVEVATTHLGAALTFVVKQQPKIDHVYLMGPGADRLELRRLRWLVGAPYDPQRIGRMVDDTRRAYIQDGYLDAKIIASRSVGSVGLCVDADPGPRVRIGSVHFSGQHAIPERELVAAIHGGDSGINHVGGIYDREALADDYVQLQYLLYEHGLVAATLRDPHTSRHGDRIDVEIPIDKGAVFRIGRLEVRALGGEHVSTGLTPGQVFVRSHVIAAIERIRERVGGDAVVVPVTRLDNEHHTVDLVFEIVWKWPWDALRLLRSH